MILTSLLFHLLVSSFPPFTCAKRNLLSLPLVVWVARFGVPRLSP